MSRSLRFIRSLFVLSCAALTVISYADFTLLGGRYFSMGQSGLALPRDVQNTRLNPAIQGTRGQINLLTPSFGARLQSISLGDLRDVVSNTNGGVSQDSAVRLARLVADRNSEAGLDSGIGLTFGNFTVDFSGAANVFGQPNDALRTYVRNGGNFQTGLTGNEKFYAYGLGGYSLNLSTNIDLPETPMGDVAVGARAKFVKNYYKQYTVDSTQLQSGNSSNLTANRDESNTGFGLDLGAVVTSRQVNGLSLGMVVENAIKPNTDFSEPVFNGQDVATTQTFKPYDRKVNLGVGYVGQPGLIFAADLYDTFGGANRELRSGVEFALGSGLAIRGGYISGRGVTYGFGWQGINVAFGKDMPVGFSTAMKF